MSKEKPIFITYIAKPLYKFFYLNPRVKVVLDDGGELDKMKGPALIVGNHSHSLDPIFVYSAMKPDNPIFLLESIRNRKICS